MSTAQANPVAPRLPIPPADAGRGGADRASAPVRRRPRPWGSGAAARAAAALALVHRRQRGAAAAAGSSATVGPPVGPAPGTPRPRRGHKASSGPKLTGEWSFLSDPSLSVEEKLSRFMIAVQKKLGDELTEDGRVPGEVRRGWDGDEEGGRRRDSSGSILKAVFPPLAIADTIFGDLDGFLKDALKALGGPLLAALATAVGMPTLAPGALKVGDALADALTGGSASSKKTTTAKKADDGAKSSGTGKGGTTTKKTPTTKEETAKKEAGTPDERLEMLEIQRLVEKQNQLFTLVSNVMKGMHDTAMVAVQNVR